MTTTRAAQIEAFTAEGTHAGRFNIYCKADWKRAYQEARERAGKAGTVMLFAATAKEFTGRIVSVSATPTIIR